MGMRVELETNAWAKEEPFPFMARAHAMEGPEAKE
jgi:hypothetical protein